MKPEGPWTTNVFLSTMICLTSIARKYADGDTDQFNLDEDNKVVFKLGRNQLKNGVPNPITVNPSVLVRTTIYHIKLQRLRYFHLQNRYRRIENPPEWKNHKKTKEKTSPKFEICCSPQFFGLQPPPPNHYVNARRGIRRLLITITIINCSIH